MPRCASYLLFAMLVLLSACSSAPHLQYLPLPKPNQPAISQTTQRPVLPTADTSSKLAKPAVSALPALANSSAFISGNKVDLLFDGPQTLAAMRVAINAAQNHIHLETYIFDQDALGTEFAQLLIARQRAGIQVNIIYDSVGTLGTPQEFFEQMKSAGIHLVAFNPVNPMRVENEWQPNHRDHRKVLIVDGKVGFTGGVNISSSYAASSLFRSKRKTKSKVGWRDTHLKIEGPAVAVLQSLFLETWASQQGPALKGNFFPPLSALGNKQVSVIASQPDGPPIIHQAYLKAIAEAKRSVHITCAYFVPDTQILEALYAAAARGVKVKLILPGVSDSAVMLHAAQSFYTDMLAHGIKIYQLQIAVLHAKTAVIDGTWSTVGSTNLDTRSFLHNSEVNLVILGNEFGSAMEKAFTEDLLHSIEIKAETWAKRSLRERTQEWMVRHFAYWL